MSDRTCELRLTDNQRDEDRDKSRLADKLSWLRLRRVRSEELVMEDTNPITAQDVSRGAIPSSAFAGRHALRDQDSLWAEFLAMGLTAIDSLSKSIAVVCEGRIDVVHEVKSLERASDRAEIRIEQECLRILALFEPVASDLRRMATVLKVNRDWERIADLSARIARRSRKLAKQPDCVPVPEQLKSLARDVLAQVCAAYEALVGRDGNRARAVIAGDRLIDRQYRRLRDELKESLRHNAGQLDTWLQLMNTARNLERISDHATGIAQAVVYLQEGNIIRHKTDSPVAND
jgi:phosphate transport system protein